MSGSSLLLDTNIIIEVFDGNKDIADKINKLSEFYIPSIVLGELYIGVNRVANKAKPVSHCLLTTSGLPLLHYSMILRSLPEINISTK